MFNLKKKYLLLVSLLIAILVSSSYMIYKKIQIKPKIILVISNEAVNEKGYKYVLEAIKLISNDIDHKFKNLKVKWINIDSAKISNNNTKYIKNEQQKIHKYIKNNHVIGVILGTTSIIVNKFVQSIPKHIPVFTDAASLNALKKTNSYEIFTGASRVYDSKGIYVEKIRKYLKLKNIVCLFKNNETYGMAIYKSLKKHHYKIELLKVDTFLKNPNFYKKKYQDSLWLVSIDNSSKKILLFSKKHLNRDNLKIFPVYPSFNKELYKGIKNTDFYSTTYRASNYKNFLDYDYLYNIQNMEQISQYDFIFDKYYSKLALITDNLNSNILSQNSEKIRTYVFKIFNKYINHFYIAHKNRYIFKFRPPIKVNNKEIVYNNVFNVKQNLVDKYLININNGTKHLLPYQSVMVGENMQKNIPVLYVTPYIKHICITTLSTDVAEMDIMIDLKYLKTLFGKPININFGDNLKILADTKLSKDTEYSLDKVYQDGKFIHKIYRVKLFVPIVNDLFYFPYDTFWVNLEFSKNSKKQPFLLYLNTDKQKHINKVYSDEIVLQNIYSTYSQDIITLSHSKLISLYHNFLLVEMKRYEPIYIIIKYLLPAFIILFIALYVAFFSIRRGEYDDGIGIVSDTILGIISVYFVFSLLISITSLIIIDLIFYMMIFILSVTLISLYRKKLKT